MFDIKYDTIDFHTHPFLTNKSNIYSRKKYCKMSSEDTLKVMDEFNISYFCGSVIGKADNLSSNAMLKAIYGIFRYSMLRHLIDKVGIDRILFGSNFSTCNLSMYVGGVLFDRTITDTEKENFFR